MARDQQILSKFRHLFQAVKRFEAKAPQYRRIAEERQALREALTEAGLLLEGRAGRFEKRDGCIPS